MTDNILTKSMTSREYTSIIASEPSRKLANKKTTTILTEDETLAVMSLGILNIDIPE